MDKDFLNKYLSNFSELMRPDDFILGQLVEIKKTLINTNSKGKKALIIGDREYSAQKDMKITPLDIPDVILLKPNLHEDERGFFYESFNQRDFIKATGSSLNFVQDNHSKSKKGVLRGLHFQLPPFAQGKLVRVIQGEVYDVAVDIRNNSPTFGKWVGQSLNAVDKQSMWIPPGFAHGFLTLSGTAELLYKTTEYYSSEYEKCIIWNDPQINISWPYKTDLCMSFRDKKGLKLEDIIADL